MARAVLAALVLAACGSPRSSRPEEQPPAPPVATPEPPAAPPAGVGLFPRCGAPDAAARRLERYDGLDAGDTRWFASVARDAGEWTPTPMPPMPFHHATRMEWTNAGDFPELGETQERLRFTFVVVSRQAEQREPRLYFITFRARIESICSESAEASRDEGARLANIGPDTSACAGLEAAVAAAAAEEAVCHTDAQCVVRDVPLCNVEGVGCYWAAVNRTRPAAPLDDAIRRLQAAPCPTADCDCPTPPDHARCNHAVCAAAR